MSHIQWWAMSRYLLFHWCSCCTFAIHVASSFRLGKNRKELLGRCPSQPPLLDIEYRHWKLHQKTVRQSTSYMLLQGRRRDLRSQVHSLCNPQLYCRHMYQGTSHAHKQCSRTVQAQQRFAQWNTCRPHSRRSTGLSGCHLLHIDQRRMQCSQTMMDQTLLIQWSICRSHSRQSTDWLGSLLPHIDRHHTQCSPTPSAQLQLSQ